MSSSASNAIALLGTEKKRKRVKKLADEFKGEMKDILCLKQTVGMSGKRGVNCSQICSLLFLFLLGGVAGNLMMMQTTVMLGISEAKANPDATAYEKAIAVYKKSMWIEF